MSSRSVPEPGLDKALGTEPSTLIYVTNRFYDAGDEGRIAFDDSRINYDWTVQHK